jgi:hypothetical protein
MLILSRHLSPDSTSTFISLPYTHTTMDSVSIPAVGIDIVPGLRSIPATQSARHPLPFRSQTDVSHFVFFERGGRDPRTSIFYPRAAFRLCHHPCIILRERDVFREDCVCQSVSHFPNPLSLVDNIPRCGCEDEGILTYPFLDTSHTLIEHSGTLICISTFANPH